MNDLDNSTRVSTLAHDAGWAHKKICVSVWTPLQLCKGVMHLAVSCLKCSTSTRQDQKVCIQGRLRLLPSIIF
ncbi:hypothetical protein AGIG_G10450 [Arapaima gigas]